MKQKVVAFPQPEQTEAVFYEAFMHGDVNVIAAIWSADNAVCVHPGSSIIQGHEAVIRSWQHILDHALSPDIDYKVLNKTQTESLAVHVVEEKIKTAQTQPAVVISTNVYHKNSEGWQMLQHHSSLVQRQEEKNQTLQ